VILVACVSASFPLIETINPEVKMLEFAEWVDQFVPADPTSVT